MCKTEEKEKRPVTFDDVLESVDYYFGYEMLSTWLHEQFPGYISGSLKEQEDRNLKVQERIIAALRDGVSAADQHELCRDLDHELGQSLYTSERPFVLIGIAVGLRMAGLEVDDIRQRMRWLV